MNFDFYNVEQFDDEHIIRDAMTERKIAIKMYQHEHSRWSQWALFFFGSIASAFVLYDQLKCVLPVRVPLVVSAFLSLLWVLVAQSIRRTSWAWRAVILALEKDDKAGKAFELFDQKKREFSGWRDFGNTMKLWTAEPYLRVTRILVFIGILSAIMFIALAITVC